MARLSYKSLAALLLALFITEGRSFDYKTQWQVDNKLTEHLRDLNVFVTNYKSRMTEEIYQQYVAKHTKQTEERSFSYIDKNIKDSPHISKKQVSMNSERKKRNNKIDSNNYRDSTMIYETTKRPYWEIALELHRNRTELTGNNGDRKNKQGHKWRKQNQNTSSKENYGSYKTNSHKWKYKHNWDYNRHKNKNSNRNYHSNEDKNNLNDLGSDAFLKKYKHFNSNHYSHKNNGYQLPVDTKKYQNSSNFNYNINHGNGGYSHVYFSRGNGNPEHLNSRGHNKYGTNRKEEYNSGNDNGYKNDHWNSIGNHNHIMNNNKTGNNGTKPNSEHEESIFSKPISMIKKGYHAATSKLKQVFG